jgi:phosphoribosylformimino-5-aminoimidazole carboxamide ribotide isomerase
MILIPAIDLKEGHCVRLRQGNMDETTVFSDDPVAMAGKWVDQGCGRLHLVDLDGAFKGEPINADVIEEISASFPDLEIQIGGGIRSIETVEAYLEAGVNYVIIGTMAVKRPEFVTQLCSEFPGLSASMPRTAWSQPTAGPRNPSMRPVTWRGASKTRELPLSSTPISAATA